MIGKHALIFHDIDVTRSRRHRSPDPYARLIDLVGPIDATQRYRISGAMFAVTEQAPEPVKEAFRDAHQRGKLRLLVDRCVGITKLAFDQIVGDDEFTEQIKWIDDASVLRCHAKGLLFSADNGPRASGIALVGSSNLTGAGTGVGESHNVEWNLLAEGAVFAELSERFEALWRHASPVDRARCPTNAVDANRREIEWLRPALFPLDVLQEEALGWLDEHGDERKMIALVMPPAAGKTVVALHHFLRLSRASSVQAVFVTPNVLLAEQAWRRAAELLPGRTLSGDDIDLALMRFGNEGTRVEGGRKGLDRFTLHVARGGRVASPPGLIDDRERAFADLSDTRFVFASKKTLARFAHRSPHATPYLDRGKRLLFADEGHHVGADEWNKAIEIADLVQRQKVSRIALTAIKPEGYARRSSEFGSVHEIKLGRYWEEVPLALAKPSPLLVTLVDDGSDLVLRVNKVNHLEAALDDDDERVKAFANPEAVERAVKAVNAWIGDRVPKWLEEEKGKTEADPILSRLELRPETRG